MTRKELTALMELFQSITTHVAWVAGVALRTLNTSAVGITAMDENACNRTFFFTHLEALT